MHQQYNKIRVKRSSTAQQSIQSPIRQVYTSNINKNKSNNNEQNKVLYDNFSQEQKDENDIEDKQNDSKFQEKSQKPYNQQSKIQLDIRKQSYTDIFNIDEQITDKNEQNSICSPLKYMQIKNINTDLNLNQAEQKPNNYINLIKEYQSQCENLEKSLQKQQQKYEQDLNELKKNFTENENQNNLQITFLRSLNKKIQSQLNQFVAQVPRVVKTQPLYIGVHWDSKFSYIDFDIQFYILDSFGKIQEVVTSGKQQSNEGWITYVEKQNVFAYKKAVCIQYHSSFTFEKGRMFLAGIIKRDTQNTWKMEPCGVYTNKPDIKSILYQQLLKYGYNVSFNIIKSLNWEGNSQQFKPIIPNFNEIIPLPTSAKQGFTIELIFARLNNEKLNLNACLLYLDEFDRVIDYVNPQKLVNQEDKIYMTQDVQKWPNEAKYIQSRRLLCTNSIDMQRK
ncbi:hypothetical protein PPERSA_05980 [Pseudocohnilembus persalinus]|uniref:Uncharacterized protein n=1 Tax=Pseudocohnilembus persalinus TaxID=266149 RepID=A0A0V0R4A3_PSEPJ|nr:hypothetical protein PPERSA_05980 [Pseudocohnilembus persalinus]|eukprot:KRX09311.1 hypothetical protein PPERSA_05980 [Pseudocohnilembus persalinus]